jgi:hypothetical protein
VMSVTTQIIFPYMSDARTPAMDVQMAAQDACMTRSFHVFLSAMLIEDDGYNYEVKRKRPRFVVEHQRYCNRNTNAFELFNGALSKKSKAGRPSFARRYAL